MNRRSLLIAATAAAVLVSFALRPAFAKGPSSEKTLDKCRKEASKKKGLKANGHGKDWHEACPELLAPKPEPAPDPVIPPPPPLLPPFTPPPPTDGGPAPDPFAFPMPAPAP